MKYPAPGSVVAVDFGFYRHLGIVTDRTVNGRPMVISNSSRAGGVHEEPWDTFSCLRPVSVVRHPAGRDSNQLLARARSRLGGRWNLLTWNCEHFTSWARGEPPGSPQLQTAMTGLAVIGTSLVLGGLLRNRWPGGGTRPGI